MDPFEQAIADAKQRLSEREGREVSWREIARRADLEHTLGGVMYHLRPRPSGRRRGHHTVPVWLVEKMAEVLPVDRSTLMIAAARAAGFDVPDGRAGTQAAAVIGVLTDERIPAAERDQIGTDVIEIADRRHG